MVPLCGIKILDLTRLLPGAYCSMLLGDLGAEIIKIEQPGIGDYMRLIPSYFFAINRNKKSIVLNLKLDQGREIFYELVKSADVVLEGFRPGVVKRLGIDYESIKPLNPQIVYCSLSGYGQDGPYRDWVGHDINYIGFGGILGLTGTSEQPIIPGIQIADLGGAMFANIAILTALLAKERMGVGQYIDVAMLDGVVSWLSIHAGKYFADQKIPERGNMVLSGGLTGYNVFETKDGKWLSLGILEPKFWENLCQVLDHEKLEKTIPFLEKAQQNNQKEILQTIIRTKSCNEWITILNNADIPCGPINSLAEVFEDPQVIHREMLCEIDHPTEGRIKQIGIPIKFSKTPGQLKLPPPELGEHTTSILRELGYTDEQIQIFRNNSVI